MVGEIHQILCRGGVFLYPIDELNCAVGGKLRLLYEGNPMATRTSVCLWLWVLIMKLKRFLIITMLIDFI